MEFFGTVPSPWTEEELYRKVDVPSLPRYCASITSLEHGEEQDAGEFHTVWGHFRIERTRVRGGVRFAMPTCPNLFVWTLTTGLPPEPADLVIHCTINRRDHDPDFIESIDSFVDDWVNGLSKPGD